MPQPKQYRSAAERQAAYRRRNVDAVQKQLRDRGLVALPAIPTIPGTARWRQAITHASALLSTVVQEMEAYFDARSEEWQESDRGEAFQESHEAIRDAWDLVSDLTLP